MGIVLALIIASIVILATIMAIATITLTAIVLALFAVMTAALILIIRIKAASDLAERGRPKVVRPIGLRDWE